MGAGGGPSVWVLPFAPCSPPEAQASPAGPPANPTGPDMGHLQLPPHFKTGTGDPGTDPVHPPFLPGDLGVPASPATSSIPSLPPPTRAHPRLTWDNFIPCLQLEVATQAAGMEFLHGSESLPLLLQGLRTPLLVVILQPGGTGCHHPGGPQSPCSLLHLRLSATGHGSLIGKGQHGSPAP